MWGAPTVINTRYIKAYFIFLFILPFERSEKLAGLAINSRFCPFDLGNKILLLNSEMSISGKYDILSISIRKSAETLIFGNKIIGATIQINHTHFCFFY